MLAGKHLTDPPRGDPTRAPAGYRLEQSMDRPDHDASPSATTVPEHWRTRLRTNRRQTRGNSRCRAYSVALWAYGCADPSARVPECRQSSEGGRADQHSASRQRPPPCHRRRTEASTPRRWPGSCTRDGREVHQDDSVVRADHGGRARGRASSVRGVPMVWDAGRVRPLGEPGGDRNASRRGADPCGVASDPFIPRQPWIPG